MSRDPQLNHTSFSLLISCNKNISAQIKKFKDLFLKTMGARERKIFATLLPALKQVTVLDYLFAWCPSLSLSSDQGLLKSIL